MFCWLPCGQAGSLPAPQQWPCWWLIWEEERSCLKSKRVTAPADILPFSTSPTVRPGLSQVPGLSQQDRGLQAFRGRQNRELIVAGGGEGSVQGHRTLPGTGHRSPRSSRAFTKSHPSGSASSSCLGARPWGLCRGQPGSGHSWPLHWPLLAGSLLFHGTVRNHTLEPAVSQFGTSSCSLRRVFQLPWEFYFHPCFLPNNGSLSVLLSILGFASIEFQCLTALLSLDGLFLMTDVRPCPPLSETPTNTITTEAIRPQRPEGKRGKTARACLLPSDRNSH